MTDKTMTDDELLSAYADNELDPAVADEITARLAREPELMRRFETLQQADGAVGAAFHAIDSTPIPDRVMELFEKQPDSQKDNVVAFPPRGIKRFFEPPVAIAAGVALIAGFISAGIFNSDLTPNATLAAGVVDTNTPLHQLLETTASGVAVSLADGTDAQVVLSFENGSGDFCRQLRVDMPARSAHGIACRRDSQWDMETIATGTLSPTGQFGQAGSEVPAVINLAVDAQLEDGEVLDIEAEKQAISMTWRNSGN